MAALREEVECHAEEYNRARARADADQAELQRATAELDAARAEFGARRQQLADYAVQAYVDGGDLPAVDGLLGGDPDATTRRLSYLRTRQRRPPDAARPAPGDPAGPRRARWSVVGDAKAAADADAEAAEEAREAAAAGRVRPRRAPRPGRGRAR